MRYLNLFAFAVLASSVHAAQTIVDVATMKDLRDAPLLRLDDGTECRLGLSSGGDAAGPWGVLYCLVERPASEERGVSPTMMNATAKASTTQSQPRGEPLGPVFYDLTWVGSDVRVSDIHRAKVLSRRSYPILFAGQALLHVRGRAVLRVYTDDGATVLAEREIEVKSPRVNNWVSFARPRVRDEPADGAEYVVMDEPWSAAPRLGDERIGASVSTTQPADVPLPAELVDDAHADSRLRLSLEEDRFVLRAPSDRRMPSITPHELLARWWVNGKPVPAPWPGRRAADFAQRQRRVEKEVFIAFGIPDGLGELKAGDRVALQLLWCPDGHEWLRSSETQERIQRIMRQHTIGWDWPVMSNRIEFALTPELLAMRDNPVPQQRPREP